VLEQIVASGVDHLQRRLPDQIAPTASKPRNTQCKAQTTTAIAVPGLLPKGFHFTAYLGSTSYAQIRLYVRLSRVDLLCL
jgi:hypothetical protein